MTDEYSNQSTPCKCPFCGGSARVAVGFPRPEHQVCCINRDCNARGPVSFDEITAISRWNMINRAAADFGQAVGKMMKVVPPENISESYWCPYCKAPKIPDFNEHCTDCGFFLGDCQPDQTEVKEAHEAFRKIERLL